MKGKRLLLGVVSCILVFLCLAPFAYILFQGCFTAAGQFTAQNYYQVFLANPQYLRRFFRSFVLAACIALGQLVLSTLAGFGFAKFRFPLKNLMFFLLMALMILPLQVTLVPNYVVLEKLGLLNTYYALALPAVFVPLGTFIMTQTFRAVPDEIIDAAKLDGCSIPGALLRVAVPMSKSGLACTLLLSFLNGWNMVEQPMVFLENFKDYPIAVALASVHPDEFGVQLACCVLVMIPPVLLFAVFNRELVDGIAFGKEKRP